MILKTFQIENFRGIEVLALDLDRITVLIGENNTGKSSVLEALHTCMSRGLSRRASPFEEYDFHLATAASRPDGAPMMTLTLTFEEEHEDEWVPEIDQAFGTTVQVLNDNRKRLTWRVRAGYDGAVRDFTVEWEFLDQAGNALPSAKQPKLVSDLQSLVPVFLLRAVREASHHFHPKSTFWGPFTKNPHIDDDQRKDIEGQIEAINQAVLDTHKPFDVVKEHIARTGSLLPMAAKDLVSVEAVPARIFDMLARTDVKLACRTAARLPIAQHGAGTQSLSILFLFEAFLQSRLADAYDKDSEPILALEEPEAHLHPSAVRALWPILDSFPGQKIVATHSGDLLAAVPLTAIRRLARKGGKVEVFRVQDSTLDARDVQKLAYHVRAKRGALFFARCWLLVEGETEFTLLPELGRLMGYDFDQSSICCVEIAQCGLAPFIKTARDLGIEWHLLADGDQDGANKVGSAMALVGTDPPSDRVTQLTEPDIEHCLWQGGYSYVYERAVSGVRRQRVTAAPGTSDYEQQMIKEAVGARSKPELAYAVVAEAIQKGPSGVPATLRTTIERAIELALRST